MGEIRIEIEPGDLLRLLQMLVHPVAIGVRRR
jgi:hypothetical protein